MPVSLAIEYRLGISDGMQCCGRRGGFRVRMRMRSGGFGESERRQGPWRRGLIRQEQKGTGRREWRTKGIQQLRSLRSDFFLAIVRFCDTTTIESGRVKWRCYKADEQDILGFVWMCPVGGMRENLEESRWLSWADKGGVAERSLL